MNFFSRQKPRTPGETVKSLKENIGRIDQGSPEAKKRVSRLVEHFAELWTDHQTNEEISRTLASIKTLISGDEANEPSPDVIAQVANEVYAQDLLSLMVINLAKFEFEVRWYASLVSS